MSGPGQRSGGGRTGADGGRADPSRLELAEDERTQAVERRRRNWWQDWRTSGPVEMAQWRGGGGTGLGDPPHGA